jgi:hypothetical protein
MRCGEAVAVYPFCISFMCISAKNAQRDHNGEKQCIIITIAELK